MGPRVISPGGNVYSAETDIPKVGLATRGRGYWAGREHEDEDNPDVDKPSAKGAQRHHRREAEHGDGFQDDRDPLLVLRQMSHATHVTNQQRKAAKQMVDAIWGVKKADAEEEVMDLFTKLPSEMTDEELVKGSGAVKFAIETSEDPYERMVLKERAEVFAHAIRDRLSKAAPSTTQQIDEKETAQKKREDAPLKAQQVSVDDKGKTQYKYPKKGNGKGPNSDGAQPAPPAPGGQPPQGAAPEQEITPPPKIDPVPFCKLIGIAPPQLVKLANKKTRQAFVDFFMQHKELVQKHSITPDFLGRLYDSVLHPDEGAQQPPQQPPQAAGAPKPPPGGMPGMLAPQEAKSIVVLNGATLDRADRAMLDLLKSYRAETIEDVRHCIQRFHACDVAKSVRMTRTLLRKWERDGIAAFYPGR